MVQREDGTVHRYSASVIDRDVELALGEGVPGTQCLGEPSLHLGVWAGEDAGGRMTHDVAGTDLEQHLRGWVEVAEEKVRTKQHDGRVHVVDDRLLRHRLGVRGLGHAGRAVVIRGGGCKDLRPVSPEGAAAACSNDREAGALGLKQEPSHLGHGVAPACLVPSTLWPGQEIVQIGRMAETEGWPVAHGSGGAPQWPRWRQPEGSTEGRDDAWSSARAGPQAEAACADGS